MGSGKGHGLRQVAPTALLVMLTGCPQLMADDFDFLDAAHTKDSLPDGEVLPDASTDLEQLKDAGPKQHPPPRPPDDGSPALDPTAQALHDALAHRWRFNVGTTLVDSVGGANATSVGATFNAGAAVLAGTGTGQYIDLPNDVMADSSSATIEAWVIWDVTDPMAPTSDWQRIFDLGSNSSPTEDVQASSADGLYLSPKSGGPQGKLHLEYRNNGNVNLDAPAALATGVLAQVVAVVDHAGGFLSLYKDGALVGSLSATLDLSTVVYRNNWLGRSQYTDAPFKGRIFDFRIYSAALTQPQIQASYLAGADADW